MLIGTGVDLIEIERIARSIERYGDRFLRRIYTDHEIAYCTVSEAVQRASPHVLPRKRPERRRWEPESAGALRGLSSRLRANLEGVPFSNYAGGRRCWPRNSE